jgi:hypothetical protein
MRLQPASSALPETGLGILGFSVYAAQFIPDWRRPASRNFGDFPIFPFGRFSLPFQFRIAEWSRGLWMA